MNGRHTQLQIIQEEIVEKRKWIPQEEFTDIVAIAQSCPGIFTVNISLLIGFKLRKTPGAICTCLGTVLPSFLIILATLLPSVHGCSMDSSHIPWGATSRSCTHSSTYFHAGKGITYNLIQLLDTYYHSHLDLAFRC